MVRVIVCVPFPFRRYDLKKALDGSDFVLYSQSTREKLGPPLALRVRYDLHVLLFVFKVDNTTLP